MSTPAARQHDAIVPRFPSEARVDHTKNDDIIRKQQNNLALDRIKEVTTIEEVDAMLAELRQMSHGAMTTVRAPLETQQDRLHERSAARGYRYAWVPDYVARLNAIKLRLAYAAGMPPTQGEIKMTKTVTGEDRRPMPVDQFIEEMKAIGATMAEINEAYAQQYGKGKGVTIEMKTVEEATPDEKADGF